jgi:hypothetical protein
MRHLLLNILLLAILAVSPVYAQVGEYRNDFAIGGGAGVTLTSVNFQPKVPQDQLQGRMAGITLRYTGEKYFSSICSVVAEANFAQMGWKESILDKEDQPVMRLDADEPEQYERQLTYFQVPVFARLGWGRERRGFQFFFQVGPQIGFLQSEKTKKNFEIAYRNVEQRTSQVIAQDTMAVEHSFDYGIAGGVGLEFSHPKVGHFLLEGRYYYGLGNLYGNSKRDYFAISNMQSIIIKLSYLFDITRVKNSKIK